MAERDGVTRLTVAELARRIRAGELGAAEVLRAHLEAIERINPSSVRLPAAFCGVVGLRPTPGVIPSVPSRLPFDTGSVHGPMARTVEDTALMLDAMAGYTPAAPLSVPLPWTSAYDEVARVQTLAENVLAGLNVTTHELGAAEKARTALWHRFRALFDRYDLLLTPTVAVLPFPVEQNYPEEIAGRKLATYIDWVASTFLVTLVGLPAASVPSGLSQAGLPIGLQIIGPRFSEPRILATAKFVEHANPVGLPPICA